MKAKLSIIILLIVLMSVLSCSCGSGKENASTSNPGVENAATRIIMFDNAVKSMTAKSQPYQETAITAYSVKELSSLFRTKPAHDIEFILADKTSKTLKYLAFLKAYLTKQAADVSPLCFGADTEIKNIYAIISGGDGVFFPTVGQITGSDLIKLFKMSGTASKYKFTAIDGYMLECTAKQMKTTLITVDEAGMISAKLPVETGAGKINDILYIEAVK